MRRPQLHFTLTLSPRRGWGLVARTDPRGASPRAPCQRTSRQPQLSHRKEEPSVGGRSRARCKRLLRLLRSLLARPYNIVLNGLLIVSRSEPRMAGLQRFCTRILASAPASEPVGCQAEGHPIE